MAGRTARRGRSRGVVLAAVLAVVVSAGSSLAACGPPAGSTRTSAGSAQAPPSTNRPSTTPPSTNPPTAASTAAPSTSSAGPAPSTAAPGTALAALAGITVGGRSPKTGYSRAMFGQAWADVDRNGCDTRNDVLRRDLRGFALKAGTRGCLVLSGTLQDPYTGRTIHFVRGRTTSSAVQIDHVVALSDAWQKGAQQWSAATRVAFANDSLNLLAVDGPTNQAKGDGDAATWLPPSRSYRCAYVARQLAVKLAYGLRMTPAERAATARVLQTCPAQRLPVAQPFRLGGGAVVAAPEPLAAAPPTTASSGPSAATDPRFGTCKEAKSHGYGPYYRGRDPEYFWYRDGDGDGVDCE